MLRLFFIILIPLTVFGSNPLDDLYNFFPKSSQLQGGNKKWLYTSITESRNDDYVRLSSTYNYYNEKEEKILGINRNTNFTVDISIYYAKNTDTSDRLYKMLVKNSNLPVRKKVDFGEESTVLFKPLSLKDFKAEYNIIIVNKNFLIDIKTDDGFALMEFADYFDKAIKNYMLANIDRFFLDRFRLKLSYKNFESVEEIISTELNISGVIIKGKVADSGNKPIKGAKLKLIGYGYETISDENGRYQFEIKYKNKKGKNLEFIKNFILEEPSPKPKAKTPFAAEVEITYLNKKEKGLIIIDKEKNTGEIYIDNIKNNLKNIKVNDNFYSFIRDCTPSGSTFKCVQKFQFIVKNNDIIGNVVGFGGKATVKGVLLTETKEENLLIDEKFLLDKITTDKKLNIANYNNEDLTINNSKEISEYIHFKILEFENSPYDISYALSLVRLPREKTEKKIPLYLFTGEINEGHLILNKKYKIIVEEGDFPKRYKFEIDSPDKEYFIGFLPEYGFNESISFSNEKAIDELAPTFEVTYFSKKEEGKATLEIFKTDKDFASTSKEIKGDGKTDVIVKISNIEGNITNIDIALSGKYKYSWSTNPLKILPVPVLRIKDKTINFPNGSVNFSLEKNDELNIYLGHPSWVSFENSYLSLKITTDKREIELSKKITKLE